MNLSIAEGGSDIQKAVEKSVISIRMAIYISTGTT